MLKSVYILLSLLILQPLSASASGQVNAFIYHRFDESRYPSTNISADIFHQQLNYLQENNYNVIGAGEIVRRLKAGEPLPEKAAALIVDDAYASFAEVAMPIVRRFGYPISLFVNTDAVGTHSYLNWAQLKNLHAEGVEIGNHTASHPYLVEMEPGEDLQSWKQRVEADILKAQQAFREQLGIEPDLFVYPYGEYSKEVVDIVKKLGFDAAFAQQSGVIHPEHDHYTLPRFPMGGPFATLEGFVNKLKMKPLVVADEIPFSTVVTDNPPELLLQIETGDVEMRRVNCFVQGENSCQVQPLAGRDGWYRVVAEQPLTGRRNKYTLTAPGKQGGWHWYSHLWLNADSPALENEKILRKGRSAAGTEAQAGKAGQPIAADQ